MYFFYLLLSSTKLTVESANDIILLFKKEFSSQDSNICSSVSGQIELIQWMIHQSDSNPALEYMSHFERVIKHSG